MTISSSEYNICLHYIGARSGLCEPTGSHGLVRLMMPVARQSGSHGDSSQLVAVACDHRQVGADPSLHYVRLGSPTTLCLP